MTKRLLATLAWVASCTFPSPDISDSCVAPQSCEIDATNCASTATKTHDGCLTPTGDCKPQPAACINCDQTYKDALNKCVTLCVQCSDSKGCYNANASCQAAVK